jgi:hypothetical protein
MDRKRMYELYRQNKSERDGRRSYTMPDLVPINGHPFGIKLIIKRIWDDTKRLNRLFSMNKEFCIKSIPFVLSAVLFIFPFITYADKIEDNSFLIEEAYNQEPGVIQHILTMQYFNKSNIGYTFTEEFPVPKETHQLSYTIPFNYQNDSVYFSDILLNYRYQLLRNEKLAIAPRLSMVLPVGDYKKAQGNGGYGVNMNLPVSIDATRLITIHLNAGLQYIPSAKNISGSSYGKFDYFSGGSIILFPTDWLNFICEFLFTDNEYKTEDGRSERERTVLIGPGLRGAIDIGSLQIVPGVSYVLDLNGDSNSLFFYLSFEHPLWKSGGDKRLDTNR